MQKRMAGASLSKWPAALTVAGLVADGSLAKAPFGRCQKESVCWFEAHWEQEVTSALVGNRSLSWWTPSHRLCSGTMSFDDKANKYLDWWSKDASDPRSKITLRHLMTFQSGEVRTKKPSKHEVHEVR